MNILESPPYPFWGNTIHKPWLIPFFFFLLWIGTNLSGFKHSHSHSRFIFSFICSYFLKFLDSCLYSFFPTPYYFFPSIYWSLEIHFSHWIYWGWWSPLIFLFWNELESFISFDILTSCPSLEMLLDFWNTVVSLFFSYNLVYFSVFSDYWDICFTTASPHFPWMVSSLMTSIAIYYIFWWLPNLSF